MAENLRYAFDEYVQNRFEHRKRDAKHLADDKRNFYCRRIIEVLKALGFENLADPNRPMDKQEEAFENALSAAGIEMITIRTAFDKMSPLLKPVATFPKARLENAERIAEDQKPEKFHSAEEALQYSEPTTATPEHPHGKLSQRFSGVYKFGDISKIDDPKSIRATIAFRIEQAVREAREKSNTFFDDPECFFSVLSSRLRRGKTRFAIDKIVAIYWKKSQNHKIPDGAVEQAHAICGILFDEIQRIQEIDNQLFLLEGHELVSSLQPTFLNADIAPADKIAFAIAKLGKLLKKHLDSHYPATAENMVDPEVYFVSISYEAIPNKEGGSEHTYKPFFQVYPHISRSEYFLTSYFISQAKQMAVTKLLLKEYFRWHDQYLLHQGAKGKMGYKAEMAREFVLGPSALLKKPMTKAVMHTSFTEELFSEKWFSDGYPNGKLRQPLKGLKIDFSEENGDRIFVSKSKDADAAASDFFTKLNVAVKGQEEENRSIIAYVVEGRDFLKHGIVEDGQPVVEKTVRQLPRAILAIEGRREELFSHAEQESLRVVAKAFANLVRYSFHDNSLLDYRSQLSDAYERFFSTAKGPTKRKRLARFLLGSMAVDVKLMGKIIKGLRSSGHDLPGNIDFVFGQVFEGTGSDDDETKPHDVTRRIRIRRERALRFAEKDAIGDAPIEYEVTDELNEFIEACPRNFAWAGYAPSLTQALGDRADVNPPTFRLMTPGFSASSLYMAVVQSEIRQVAKLSSLRKLNKEYRNYRNFVRYKLVLAARMASHAVAFDSRGHSGKEQGEKEPITFIPGPDYQDHCYGVLVSDLASSRKLDGSGTLSADNQVSTLQDLSWDAILGFEEQKEFVEYESIVRAIGQLFSNNLGHWFRAPTAEDLKEGSWGTLIRAFRLNYEDKPEEEVKFKKAEHPTPSDFAIKEQFQGLLNIDSSYKIFEGVFGGGGVDGKGCAPASATTEPEENPESAPYIKENVAKIVLAPDDIYRFTKLHYQGALKFPDVPPDELAEHYGSVVHGDLNARNLVWAGPIDHLIMIDFEHTTVGLMGVDQARLAVNLVVDHFAAYSARSLGDEGRAELAELEVEIRAVAKAAEYLVDCLVKPAGVWNSSTGETSGGEHAEDNGDDGILVGIVEVVLKTVSTFFDVAKHPDYKGIANCALVMALVKEYEYAIENVIQAKLDPEQASLFLRAHKSSNGKLCDWLTALFEEKKFTSSDRELEQLTSVSRYAVTFWILRNIFDQVTFLPQSR